MIKEQDFNKVVARRGFIRVLTAAGVSTALASKLGNFAMAQGGPSDVDILNLALTAEYLAVDAYTNALKAGFSGEIKAYLEEAKAQEEVHVKALTDTITGPFKAKAVAMPKFTYGALMFNQANQMKILETMIALETAFTGAYLGAIPLIQNKDVLAAAAAIAMNEEAHLTLLRDSLLTLGGKVEGKQVPNGRAFGVAITPEQATNAVTSFIAK
jgi:rubrerythrin